MDKEKTPTKVIPETWQQFLKEKDEAVEAILKKKFVDFSPDTIKTRGSKTTSYEPTIIECWYWDGVKFLEVELIQEGVKQHFETREW